MNVFSETEIRTFLRLYREPVERLSEDANWWQIGVVDVSKKQPLFRAGFGAPILQSTQFVLQQFRVNEIDGYAIVLLSGGKPPAFFAGWVPADRANEAKQWVETLNQTIQAVLPQSTPTTSTTSPPEPVATIVFESGSESAPDDPFGRETIEIDDEGHLKYERRRHTLGNTVIGTVDQGRFQPLVDSLRRTTFPVPPQTRFAPGASIVRITTLPSGHTVQVSYFEALRMEGYRDVVRELSKLAEALRDMKSDVLAGWSFSPA